MCIRDRHCPQYMYLEGCRTATNKNVIADFNCPILDAVVPWPRVLRHVVDHVMIYKQNLRRNDYIFVQFDQLGLRRDVSWLPETVFTHGCKYIFFKYSALWNPFFIKEIRIIFSIRCIVISHLLKTSSVFLRFHIKQGFL